MPVKAIKHILNQEHVKFMQALRQNIGPLVFIEDYLVYSMDLTLDVLNKCESYADLEDFVGQTRRMSLEEWINSL